MSIGVKRSNSIDKLQVTDSVPSIFIAVVCDCLTSVESLRSRYRMRRLYEVALRPNVTDR